MNMHDGTEPERNTWFETQMPPMTAAEQADFDSAWAEEIERRLSELHSGTAQTIPAEQLMRELRAKFGL